MNVKELKKHLEDKPDALEVNVAMQSSEQYVTTYEKAEAPMVMVIGGKPILVLRSVPG